MISKIRKKFLSFIGHKKKTSFLIGLLVCLIFFTGLVKTKTDFGFKVWYSKTDPLILGFDQFEKDFGNDDQLIISLNFKESVLKKKNIELIHRLSEGMWEVRDVMRVDSLSNYNTISSRGDEIIIKPFFEEGLYSVSESLRTLETDNVPLDYLISEDKEAALIYVKLKPFFEKKPDYSLFVQETYKKIDEILPKNFEYYLSGSAKLTDDFKEATLNDFTYITVLIHIIFFLLLFLIFKSVMSIIYSFMVIWVGVLATFSFNALMGYDINVLSSVMPIILITIGLADSIHIMSSFVLKIKLGEKYQKSLDYALEKNFYPTVFTTISTAIGFFSFYSSSLEPIKYMGVTTGFGAIIIWLLSYLFSPLLVWSERYKFTKFNLKNKEKTSQPKNYKIVKIVERHYKFISFSSIVIILVLLFPVSKLTPNINPFEQFKKNHPMRKSIKFLSEKIGGITPVEIVIDSKTENGVQNPVFLNEVKIFSDWLNSKDYIHKTVSLLEVIMKTNQVLKGPYRIPDHSKEVAEQLFLYTLSVPEGKGITGQMNLDRSKLRLTAFWSLEWSTDGLVAIKEIENKAREMNLEVSVTGKLPLFLKMNPYIVDTFKRSFLTALILITIFIILCLKSFRLGMLALIPNVFPLVLGGSLFYFFGFYLDLGTVLVGSVCLGIAVDDSIHMLFDFQKNRKAELNFTDNFNNIIRTTFPALFFTTLLLVIGFSSLATADYMPNIKFGVSVSAILAIALVTDFIILPALLKLFFYSKTKK